MADSVTHLQVQKRILVVDDEQDVTTLVAYHLRAKGYQVDVLQDPNLVLEQVRLTKPSLIILDVMMPELDGIRVCRMLRADSAVHATPIIFLSARSEDTDRIRGLEVGGDDYINKPFNIKELCLRVASVLRRSENSKTDLRKPQIHVGRVTLDVELHRADVAGEPMELTATEFRLLQTLMERKGRVQARDHLLLNVWNYETEIETRTVDTHIRRLREKLGSDAWLIETVRGVGYRMVERKPESCSP